MFSSVMRFLIVLSSVVTFGAPTKVAIELWRSWGGASTVNEAFADQSLTDPERARKLLPAIETARFLFTPKAQCSDESLGALYTDDIVHEMCRHMLGNHLIHSKLGNERLAEYVEHSLTIGEPPESAAQLAYFTPLAELVGTCGFSLDRVPLDMFQVIMRSKVVDWMVMSNKHVVNKSITFLHQVLSYSLHELYLHTANPKSLSSLFDQVETVLNLEMEEADSAPFATTVGRLAGLSVAHAIPMGEELTQLISKISGKEDFTKGLNDIVPGLSTYQSRLTALLAGENPIEVPYDSVIESLVSDITETGIFFAEYLRGDDQLGKAQLRVEAFLRQSTGLRSLSVGGVDVLAPAITLKIVPLDEEVPSFDYPTRTTRLPAYPTAEKLFESLDKYFHL